MAQRNAGQTSRRLGSGPKFALVVLILIAALFYFWNWDWFKPFVEAQASSALGRKVTLQHLQVDLGRITQVSAIGITIADPEGFTKPGQLVTIGRLRIDADIWAYILHQTLVLPVIEADNPTADVQQLDNGQNNYTLHMAGGKSKTTPPQIGNLVIKNGKATVVMPKYKTNFQLTVATRPDPDSTQGDEIVAEAHGTYSGQPIIARFIGGALLSLRDPAHPYPVNLHIENGTTRVSLIGTISQPMTFGGANLALSLSGQDMSNLYPLTGVPIPATPPYSIKGRLNYAANAVRFENFEGRVGSSDLEGTIAETTPLNGGKRLVTADLASRRVDLTDLAGFLGAQPGKAKTPGQDAATQAKQAAAEARPNLLPETQFNLPKLSAANVELHYKGAHIINKDVPFDDVVVDLSIENGRITLHPLNFAVGTGTIASNADLNPVDGVLHTTANIDFRQLPLARLMAATHAFAGDGVVGGSAHLTATGNSVAEMLGHGNGGLRFFMNQGGDVSALMVDLAGLQVGDAVLSALGIPAKTQIECLITDFTLTNGQVNTKAMLLATPEANILGSGTADLTDEKLNLALHTEATHFSIGSLSTPINIGGTLKDPSILPAAGPLAARAIPAAALGVLFPPLALLPTIRLGLGDKNACVDTLLKIREN